LKRASKTGDKADLPVLGLVFRCGRSGDSMGDEISEYIFKLFAVVVGDSPWINHDTFCAIIDCT